LGLLRWGWYRDAGLRVSAWETSFAMLTAIAFCTVLVVLPAWPFAWVSYEPLDAHGMVIKRVPAKPRPARPPHKHKKLF